MHRVNYDTCNSLIDLLIYIYIEMKPSFATLIQNHARNKMRLSKNYQN